MKKNEGQSMQLIHYTYKWNLDSIRENGLLASIAGRMPIDGNEGEGLYCVRANDYEAQETVLDFMEEEVNWTKVSEFLDSEDGDEYIERNEYIVAITFSYDGTIYESLSDKGFVKKGYIVIPQLDENRVIVNPDNINIEGI